MISKFPFFGFYPSLYSFISNFLSDCYIAVVVYGQYSSPKPINSGVPRGSVLSHTLFLLFINDLLNLTQRPIQSYADDTTLHFFTSFSRRPNQKQVNDSCGDTTERQTSDLSFQIGIEKTLYCSMLQKLTSFIYPLDKTFQITVPSTSMTHTCSLLLH